MESKSQATKQSEISLPITLTFAEAIRRIEFDNLPSSVIELAKHCFLDWLGVTLAGSQEPAPKIILSEARSLGEGGQYSIVGHGVRTSALWAALINGTASHALDFDDVVSAMTGHPSVPVFSALLAAAEQEHSVGRDFIAAFVAGFETECRVGTLVAPAHYERGFHSTATMGAFGAAAACAHLAKLSLEQWRIALGLAGTQAAGLKSMFGTMAKPFHAGRAASNGLLAASLAAAGFTANVDVLETEQGFAATHTDAMDINAALGGLGHDYAIAGVLFKYHAACYLTHASIDALKQLKVEHEILPHQVQSVHLRVNPGHLKVCNIQNPSTGLEAKFSLRFTAALALAWNDTSDRVFTDEMVKEPTLVALMNRIVVHPVSEIINRHASEVEITLNDGTALYATGDVSRPSGLEELDKQWSRLTEKFTGLVEPLLGVTRTAKLIERIRVLETDPDIGEFLSLSTI